MIKKQSILTFITQYLTRSKKFPKDGKYQTSWNKQIRSVDVGYDRRINKLGGIDRKNKSDMCWCIMYLYSYSTKASVKIVVAW
jgi:hypothetical protein